MCIYGCLVGNLLSRLCFSEDTCKAVRTETVREENGATQRRTEGARSGSEEINAADVWRASGDEIVIGSKFWEWCEEKLIETRENQTKGSAEME